MKSTFINSIYNLKLDLEKINRENVEMIENELNYNVNQDDNETIKSL